jgi:hypothetical protein
MSRSLDEQVAFLAPALRDAIDSANGKDKIGFALFLFDYGHDGRIAYASTADRETFISTLEEFLVNIKADKPTTVA